MSNIEMWGSAGLSEVEITSILSKSKPALTESKSKVKAVVPGAVIVLSALTCFLMPFFFHALANLIGKEIGVDCHPYAIFASSLVCIMSILLVVYTSRFEVSK